MLMKMRRRKKRTRNVVLMTSVHTGSRRGVLHDDHVCMDGRMGGIWEKIKNKEILKKLNENN